MSLTDSNQVFEMWIEELDMLLSQRAWSFEKDIQPLEEELSQINQQLKKKEELTVVERYELWIQKMELQEYMHFQQLTYELEISKLRYKKGVELIRLLYEKVLGLDHHFTTLQTFQDVAMLSNPNNNPDFQSAKKWIEGQEKKKPLLQLPDLLETNPYLSSSIYLVKMLMGVPEQGKNRINFEEIACVMDFTVRMNNELNTIYYETSYLQENNQTLIEACNLLFEEYTKVVNYLVPLQNCREADDWSTLYKNLDVFVEQIDQELKDGVQNSAYKKQVNLEFAVDRLLEYINTYNGFIKQGEKYYRKFQIILNNYPNEAACLEELPQAYLNMKEKVEDSIYKFKEAYDIAEIKGSKLKDLLYGF